MFAFVGKYKKIVKYILWDFNLPGEQRMHDGRCVVAGHTAASAAASAATAAAAAAAAACVDRVF